MWLLQNVLGAALHDCADVIIRQRVDHVFAFPAVADKSGGFKEAKLMGDCRYGQSKQLSQIAYAHLGML